MPNINDIYPAGGDWLKSDDLKRPDGRYGRVTGVIVEATVVLVKDRDGKESNKVELKFQGKEKAVLLNKTNSGNIAMAFGPMTEGWIGQTVGISVHQTSLGPGLLVTPMAAQAQVQPAGATGQAIVAQGVETVMDSTKPPYGDHPSAPNEPGPAEYGATDLDDDIPF